MTFNYLEYFEKERIRRGNTLAGLSMARLEIDIETIKLFNPFHSKADGRFASGKGGSGGGLGSIAGGGSPDQAGVVAGINAKSDVLAKATAKKGFPFKTTGAVLGLTGLGLVGVAVVQANSGKSFDEYRQENLETKATEAEELQAQLQELTKNWPKDITPEQAMSLAVGNLQAVGIEGIPADIKVSVGSTPMGTGAYYDPETNTFTMNPQIAAELASGGPLALAAVFHEVAHSNQELQGENFTVGLDEFPESAPFNNPEYRALMEGQNDLVAHMALSRQYGQPMSNETVVDQHGQARELNSSIMTLETGVTITSSGGLEVNKYGYQQDASVYAAIANEGAKLTGQSPQEYLISNHNEGFNLQRQHQNLVDLFPEEMKRGNFYQEVEETEGGLLGIGGTTRIVKKRQFPSTSEIRKWMKQHGYVDPDKAYDQMLKVAANG